MVFALVLYGHSGNGKTYTSKILASHLNAKLIPFDEIINIISEYTRKKIGNKAPFIDFEGDEYPKIFEKKERLSIFSS